MPVLADTAQVIMNLYYQSYRKDADFFRLFHFKYITGAVISKIMEEEYKAAKQAARVDDPSAEIDLPAEWLIGEVVEVKQEGNDNIITLKHTPFQFPYDLLGRTVQYIETADGPCRDFVRISVKEKWKFERLPQTKKIFFYVEREKVFFVTKDKLGKLKVHYAPDITSASFGEDGGVIPVSKEEEVIRRTLDIMMKARQGTVVDMTNNSNPNKTIQTEIDTTFGNLRTKPI